MRLFSVIINAGGSSRRMGQDKALLPTPPDGLPLIVRLIARLRPLHPEQFVVVAATEAIGAVLPVTPDVTVVADRFPGIGPLSGIASGLLCCTGWAAVVACDMPLVNPQVLAALAVLASEEWDAVVPRLDDRFQPMHAFYHRRCLPAVEAAIHAGQHRAVAFFPAVRVRAIDETAYRLIDPELQSLVNVNTPEEWRRVFPLLG